MIKTLKLSASLGGLVTASIGVTALSLPQFNSTDSYIYRNLNANNWSQIFTSNEAAQAYLEGVIENGLLNEAEGNTRTVSSYLVDATMNGLDVNYLFFEDKQESFSGQSENTQADYNAIRNEFIKLLTDNFTNQLITMGSNVYIPLEDYVAGDATTSTGGTHALAEYFRGAGDTAYDTLDSAFASLLDQSAIAFEYNSTNYDTIADVVLAWMTDNGFEGTNAYETVVNHIRWEATSDYIDSDGVNHGFIESSEAISDSDAFKNYAQNSFYSRMVSFEQALIDEKMYTTAEWEADADYTASRDAWIAQNEIIVDPALNNEILNNTMGEAWGYADGSRTINGPGAAFFPVHDGGSYSYYQFLENSKSHFALPNLNQAISSNYDFAAYSFMAFIGPEFTGQGASLENYLPGHMENYCNDNGSSNRSGSAWQSWTDYAEFMGFDNIDIPVSERTNALPGTVNKWWEPDCEGIYLEKYNDVHSNNNPGGNWAYGFDFFGEWFLHYFNYDLTNDTSRNYEYNHFFASWNSSTNAIRSDNSNFTFSANTMNGSLTGLSMIEALLDGNSVPATEADYKATAADYQRDFLDWESRQDVILYWNKAEYRGQSEAAARLLVDAAIRSRIEAEWININYNHVTNTDYDIDASHLAIIRAIDPTIQATDFYSIEEARTAVRSAVEANGADNIWTEVGLVSFINDAYYNFDTSVTYPSINAARLAVSWDATSSNIMSAIGQTGTYSTLKEYHLDRVMKLINFNGTTTDIMFDMSVAELSSKLVSGYDLSHLDSSLSKIEMNISDYDLDDVHETVEYVTFKFSLAIDNIDENETYWVESDEFILNSEDHLNYLLAAKAELIDYWTTKLEG